MQRRAAAAYIAFFLVIAAGSYAFIATAEEPAVTISGDNVQEIEQGDELTVDGRTYTVSEVSATEESGGGHGGGGGGLSYTLAFTWTNDSARYTETWESNATIEYEGQTRRVLTENGSGDVVLRWEPGEQYSPRWSDGVQYVDDDPDQGGRQDVAVTEFIARSNNSSIGYVNMTEGDTIDYKGNQTTVESVTNDSVTLAWTAPTSNTVETSNHQNVTLNGQPYVVHFQDNDTVLLGQGESAQQQLQENMRTNERFHDRINGVWGVTITSGATALFLVALAFLPRKE